MPSPDENREFEIVLFGATGFTGRLVAECLIERHGAGADLRWALAGRSQAKLERVRRELLAGTGIAEDALPILVADGDDAPALDGLARRTKVVCTTVGPYAKHGSKLVAACVRNGTHACDLTGEVPWMRRMIDAHSVEAEASGARIVHTCGFDSIPSDLGVFFLQREVEARDGLPSPHVRGRVKGFSGAASGGTIASMLNMLDEAEHDPAVRRLLVDPYALNPEGRRDGPDSRDALTPLHDDAFDQWTAPFVMAGINTRVVRRTNALLGDRYGTSFRYDESMLTGPGIGGWLKAAATTGGLGAVMGLGAIGPLRRSLTRFLPAPGDGPSEEQRMAGWFDLRFHAEPGRSGAAPLRAKVTGDRDPGYGSTSRMLTESALCLARDPLAVGGGFFTPASAMGEPLLKRLEEHAGLSFQVIPLED